MEEPEPEPEREVPEVDGAREGERVTSRGAEAVLPVELVEDHADGLEDVEIDYWSPRWALLLEGLWRVVELGLFLKGGLAGLGLTYAE